MKILTPLFLIVATLFCSVGANASGTDSWGGLPPPPTTIVIKFNVPTTDPAFAGQLVTIRNLAAQFIVAGKTCQYIETNDTPVFGGPQFYSIRIEFYDYKYFSEAQQKLNHLDPTVAVATHEYHRGDEEDYTCNALSLSAGRI